MPMQPPRITTSIPRPAWGTTHGQKRIGGHLLQRLRLQLWTKADGRCAQCRRPILLSEGIRDHVIPLAQGTQDRPTNDGCQWLCHECSDRKTQAEALHGRG
jgi:5-methylcytosine-specific restriction endonuclease McrA